MQSTIAALTPIDTMHVHAQNGINVQEGSVY